MTREEFEQEVDDIKELMLDFYLIKDKAARKKFRRIIIDFVKQLIKV